MTFSVKQLGQGPKKIEIELCNVVGDVSRKMRRSYNKFLLLYSLDFSYNFTEALLKHFLQPHILHCFCNS